VIDSKFFATLSDSIAPGGSVANDVTLPSASAVGCDEALAVALGGNAKLQELADAIMARADGSPSFQAMAPDERHVFLEAVQRERPEAFAALVTLTLAHYYAHPLVLAALGWPSRPPQPQGHKLPAFDDTMLAPVLARGAKWRQC